MVTGGHQDSREVDPVELEGGRKSTPSQSSVSSSTNLTQPNRTTRDGAAPLFRPIDLGTGYEGEDRMQAMQQKVSYLTRSMHHNLQALAMRGDSLVELERRAGSVEVESRSFSRGAKKVERNLWWKERNFQVAFFAFLGIVLSLLLAYILVKKMMPM